MADTDREAAKLRSKLMDKAMPLGIKLGLMYAVVPISFGFGDLIRKKSSDSLAWWAAAGIVFATCVLTARQAYAAGVDSVTAKPDAEASA